MNISGSVQQYACLEGTFQPSLGQVSLYHGIPGYYVSDRWVRENQTAASIGYFTTGNGSTGQIVCSWNYTTVLMASTYCLNDWDGDGVPDFNDDDDDGDLVSC